MFWSDASNLGWGATVADQFASGVWLEGEVSLSINQRELLAIERGLRALCACLEGRVVAVFSDNTTAVACLRRQGGTLSPALNAVAQRILRWAERLNINLMPPFVPGRNNVVADASVSHQSGSRLGVDAPSGCVQLAPPALAGDNRPVCLLTQSPLFCLFCACVGPHGCGYRCHAPVLGFATGVCFPSIRHDQPGPGEGEGLPGSGAHAHSSVLAPASVVPGATGAADSAPSSSSIPVGSSAAATRQKISPEPVHALSSCVETLRRFARASGFSRSVARRLGQARRQSSVANYQSKWLTYRCWCTDKGHSVSHPSTSKVADYLVWLWEDQGLSLSSVKAHRSMLSLVFRFKLPSLGKNRVLQNLMRSFAIERPRRPQTPPSWDLDAVLQHLMSSAFEPVESVSLRALTKKTLFLVSLATAKRVGEIQALSKTVAAIGNDVMVSYLTSLPRRSELMLLFLTAFAARVRRGLGGRLPPLSCAGSQRLSAAN